MAEKKPKAGFWPIEDRAKAMEKEAKVGKVKKTILDYRKRIKS